MARIRTKKRLTPEPMRTIRLWFRYQPNGKITCAQYVGDNRIEYVKPFEPSMWRHTLRELINRMELDGWPKRTDVKFLWEEKDNITNSFCTTALAECKLHRYKYYPTVKLPTPSSSNTKQ